MIDLTPLDVRKKKEDFKRAVRGYDPLQVDAFLEVVSDRLEQLVREHGSMTDRLEQHERQLQTYQERERALNEALLAAQELREEARSQAERDAAVRLREAETHAEAILLDADQAIRHSQRRLEDLRLRRGQFLKSLGTLIERFEDYIELENTRLEAEPDDLANLLERLQTDLGEEPAGSAPAGRPSVDATSTGMPADAASDIGRPQAGPIDVDLSATAEDGPAGENAAPAAEAPESTRNGDTPYEPERTEAPGQAGVGSGPAPGSRVSPTSITPADAGGSDPASS